MPKMKTNRAAAKRFRRTGSGKFKRSKSHARHILTKKSQKRMSDLHRYAYVSKSDQKRVERLLPYN
ncbi:MAG: 50S ribosomal protein L35 [Thermaerobacter sp.]|nr:50S ribosomal protein L35 [Thermaerobacter sp.]